MEKKGFKTIFNCLFESRGTNIFENVGMRITCEPINIQTNDYF